MLTDLQQQTIDTILSIFETDVPSGDYSNITFSEGDAGQLTYGKHQTTLASGNLAILVQDYVNMNAGLYFKELATYLPDLYARRPKLNYDTYLKNLLRAAADDKAMRDTQERFFARIYRKPAYDDAGKLGMRDALSWCVRYDGQVHGSWGKIAQRTNDAVGKFKPASEHEWISTYVSLRRQWLAGASGDLPKTVYRMDAFRKLMTVDLWDLKLPLIVRGHEISVGSLNEPPAKVYDGPVPGSRNIAVQSPMPVGRDVRAVQVALSRPGIGYDAEADAKYGKVTAHYVAEFQKSRGMGPTGTVDKPTFQALGIAV